MGWKEYELLATSDLRESPKTKKTSSYYIRTRGPGLSVNQRGSPAGTLKGSSFLNGVNWLDVILMNMTPPTQATENSSRGVLKMLQNQCWLQ